MEMSFGFLAFSIVTIFYMIRFDRLRNPGWTTFPKSGQIISFLPLLIGLAAWCSILSLLSLTGTPLEPYLSILIVITHTLLPATFSIVFFVYNSTLKKHFRLYGPLKTIAVFYIFYLPLALASFYQISRI
jgi:hypothetical protein